MKVSELGEFGLIDLLAKMTNSSQDKQLLIGIGDDAAAWYGDTSVQLATTDSLIQDVHFSLDIISWGELGWKALAVNMSDIAAMGGISRYVLIALALPGHTEVESVMEFYRGMIELAQQSGVAIIGGDTSSASLVTIAVTVLGSAQNRDKHILTRSTARPGEQIAVTGYLGGAAAGLEMLTKRLQFDSEATAYLRKAFLQPYPRTSEGQLLIEQGIKAAIDISDGLISDLGHICKASQVGAWIVVDDVPVPSAVKANFGEKSLQLALSGGEDYELLFTGSAEAINKVRAVASCPVTVIGEIIADKKGKVTLVDKKGSPFNLSKKGWEHFTT